jgi:hypothetical protein
VQAHLQICEQTIIFHAGGQRYSSPPRARRKA